MHGYLCIHIIYYIKLYKIIIYIYIYQLLLCINDCISCVILIYYTVKLCVYIGSKKSRLIYVNWLDLFFKRLYIAVVRYIYADV